MCLRHYTDATNKSPQPPLTFIQNRSQSKEKVLRVDITSVGPVKTILLLGKNGRETLAERSRAQVAFECENEAESQGRL